MFYKLFNAKIKEINTDEAVIEGVFSTPDEDRHGDVVVQNWDLGKFKSNPVILNSHNYYDALEVIGKAEDIEVKNNQLQGKIRFAVNENPKAKVIYEMYANKFLNTFSVGFIPLEWDKDGKILKSELLEISAVAVPANAMALAKSKGIDVEPLFNTIPNVSKEKTIYKVELIKVPKFKKKAVSPVKLNKTGKSVNETLKSVLNILGESKQVETGINSLRADEKKLVNQAIRKLLKLKK